MKIEQYLEMLFNDCSNPIYFMDYHTKELVYINQVFQKKFQIFEDYKGESCCDVVRKFTGPCPLCEGLPLEFGSFTENRIFSESLQKNLRSNSTLMDVQGRTLIITKFFLTGDSRREEAKENFEIAMTKCLEILSMSDRDKSIQAFLALLGQYYHSQLVYIYQFDSENNTMTNNYSWLAKDCTKVIPKEGDSKDIKHFLNWLESAHGEEIVYIDYEGNNYPLIDSEIYEKYHMKNLVLSKLWDKDKNLMGIVGLSNCEQVIQDDRLLKAISRFMTERFNEQSMMRAMENLHEIDLLTGFYNRNMYAEKLASIHKNPPKSLGILFVNINGLRKTNEYFGFEVGDVQIKKTSLALKDFFHNDFYRISGDEFVGFIPECDKSEFEKNVDELQLRLKSKHDDTTFSLGHAWDQGNYKVTDLVKIADTVMTINKQSFYFNHVKDTAEISNTMLKDLFQAIAEDEFMVYLQPQVLLNTEEVVGAEALIRRFSKKENRMIFPDQFIPLYEQNSIIRHVDLFVIRRVCRILLDWGHFGKRMPISVNLSRVTLMEHGIVKTISDICDEHQLPHDLLIIEVTERIGLIENEVASTLVEEFKAQGFKLSLDDFGCAYSNIVTLAKISVDEVKIDKSLMDDVLENPKNQVIVESMVSMCSKFQGTNTLAEGIEVEEQAQFLREIKCHLGQGYLYSRPIPAEEFFEKYIKGSEKSP